MPFLRKKTLQFTQPSHGYCNRGNMLEDFSCPLKKCGFLRTVVLEVTV